MKKFILTIIAILFIICATLIFYGYYLSSQDNSIKQSTPVKGESVLLNKISKEFLDLDYINQIKSYYTITSVVENNIMKVEMDPVDGDTAIYYFEQDGDYLKFKTDSVMGAYVFSRVIEAVEKMYQYKTNVLNTYLNSVISSGTNTDYFTYKKKGNNMEYSIYIKEKIDENILNIIIANDYIKVADLKTFEDIFKDNSGTLFVNKGNVSLKLIENNESHNKFILAETGSFTAASLKSLSQIVEYLYPNELTSFNSNMKSISNAVFGRYTINMEVENSVLADKFLPDEIQTKKFCYFIVVK